MWCWDSRGHYYVQWIKSFHWLQSSLSDGILNSMRHFTSAQLAEGLSCMMLCIKQWSGFSKHVLDWLSSRILLDCQTFVCLHRELCANESFCVSRCDTDTGKYRRISALERAILCRVEECISKRSKTAEIENQFSRAVTYNAMHVRQCSIHVTQNPCGKIWFDSIDYSSQRIVLICRRAQRPLQF